MSCLAVFAVSLVAVTEVLSGLEYLLGFLEKGVVISNLLPSLRATEGFRTLAV